MPTSLQVIAKKAQESKETRFLNLDEQHLQTCWLSIRQNAAYGVDRISAEEYEENLVDNIRNLVERLKRKSYRARLVRRHWIPKTDGRMRPLGIPVVEDKHCKWRSREYWKRYTNRISAVQLWVSPENRALKRSMS
jgi:thymidylate synthase